MEIQECMIHHPTWPLELNLPPPPPAPSADDLNGGGADRQNNSRAHSPRHTHNVSSSSLATSPTSMNNTTNDNPLTFGFTGICPSPYFDEVVVGGDLIFRGPRLQIALLQTKPTTAPTPSVFQNASSKAASFGLSPNGQLLSSMDNNKTNTTSSSSSLSTNNYNSGALRSYIDPVSLRRIYLGDDVFMCSLVAANALPGEVLIDTAVASMVEKNAENLGYPETGLPVDICVPNRDGLRPQVQLFHRKRSLRGPFLRPDLYQATTTTHNGGGGGASSPLLSPKDSMQRAKNAMTPSSVLKRRLMTPDDGGDSSLNNTARSLNITQRGGSKSSLLLPDESVLSRLFTTMKILRRRVKDGNAHASRLEAVIGAKDLLLKDIRKDVLNRAHFELSYPETVERLLQEDHTIMLLSPTNAPQKAVAAAPLPPPVKGALKPVDLTASELLKMSLVSGTKMTLMAITFAHSDDLLSKLPRDDIGSALAVWESIISSCLKDSGGVEIIRRPSGIVRVVCFPADKSLSCLSFWTDVCKKLVKAADWPPRLDETVEAGMMAMRDVLSVSINQKSRGEGGLGGGRASMDDSTQSMMAGSNRFVDMDELVWRGLRPVASIVYDTPAVTFNPCSHEYEISCGEGLGNPNGLLPVLPGDGVVDQLTSLLDLCDEGECLISEPAEDMLMRAKSSLKYPKISFDAYGPIYRVVLKEFKARNRFKVTFPVTYTPHVTSFFDFATRYRPKGFDPSAAADSSIRGAGPDVKSQTMQLPSPEDDDSENDDHPVEATPQLAASFTKAALSTDVTDGGDLSVAIVHVLAPQLLSGVNNPFKTSASSPSPVPPSSPAQDTTPNSDAHATPPGAASLEVSGTMDKFVLPKRPSLLIDVSHPTALEPAANVASAAVTILESALQDALRTYQKCVTELIHENNGKLISVDNHECPTEWSVVFAVPIQGLAFSVGLHRTLLNCPWSRLLLRQPAFREILKNDTTVMKGARARIGVHKVPSLATAMHPITGVEVYDNCEMGVACALAHNAHDGETYCSEAAHDVMLEARRRSQDVDLKVYSDNIARMIMVSAAHPALRGTRPLSIFQLIPMELQFRAALFIQEDRILMSSSSKGETSLMKMKTQAQKESDRREEIAKAIEEDSEFLTTVELTMNPIEHPVYKNSHQNGYIVSQLAYHKKRALTCEKTLALLESVNMMSQENIQHPYTSEAPRRQSVVTGQRLKNRKGFPPHMQLVLRELETSPTIAKDVLFDRRYAAELIYGKSGGLGTEDDDDASDVTDDHLNDTDTNASTINRVALDSTTTSTTLGVRTGRSKKNNTSHTSLLNSSPIRRADDEDVSSSPRGGGGASPKAKGEAPEPTRISKIRQAVQPEDLVQLHIDVDRFTNLMLLHGPNGHMVRTWLDSYPEFIAPDANTTSPSHASGGGGGGMTPTHFSQSDAAQDALLSPSSASEAKDLRRLRVLTSMKTPVGMDMETMNFDKMRHSVIANLSLLLYRLANPNDPNSEGYNYRENMFAATDGGGVVGRGGSKPRKKTHK